MSLTSMISGAILPLTNPASLFKNPAQSQLTDFASSQSGLGILGNGMTATDPAFNPAALFSQMTSATSGITTELTSKVSKLGLELPLTLAASTQSQGAAAVDSILAGNIAGIPNQINNAFAGNNTCPSTVVSDAFKSVTDAGPLVSIKIDTFSLLFNNTGSMTPLYTALNAIPGVAVTTGKELLNFLGNIPAGLVASVTATVNSTIAGNPSLLTGLKSNFTAVGTTVTSMTSDFNGLVSSSSAAVTTALNTVIGSNLVNMVNSDIPCVQKVMNTCVNPTQVDQNALALKNSINAKEVFLPGQESVVAVKTNSTLQLNSPANKVKAPAAQMITPNPGQPTIDSYSSSQLAGFRDQLETQNDLIKSANKIAAEWYKTNIEIWKESVSYNKKKVAVAATVDAPYGTQGTEVELAEWKVVYDQWIPLRDTYNNTYVSSGLIARTKFDEMKSEYNNRAAFGKYPYTYRASIGQPVPADRQFTYFDSTK